MLRANGIQKSDIADVLDNILTAKLGLALSGFGTIIWGWGAYFGWWTFSYLLVWAFFVLRDVHRDNVHLQNSEVADAVSKTL